MEKFLDFIIKLSGSNLKAELLISVVIASAAILAFIFNIIYAWRLRVSNRLITEKEAIDRALNFLKELQEARFTKLILRKASEYPAKIEELKKNEKTEIKSDYFDIFPDDRKEIIFFLNYFDNLALLYLSKKINRQIFESRLKTIMVGFFHIFMEEIKVIINQYKESPLQLYYYKNFLILVKNILQKMVKKPSENKLVYQEDLKLCNTLLI